MHAIEECRVANHALYGVRDLPAHLGLVIEPPLAILHLAAQVRSRVEPEAGRVLGLVTGGIEVVQSVGEAIERVELITRGASRLICDGRSVAIGVVFSLS